MNLVDILKILCVWGLAVFGEVWYCFVFCVLCIQESLFTKMAET